MMIGAILLFTAIFLSDLFYSSYSMRLGTFAIITVSTISTLPNHSLSHPILSYLFGLLSVWIIVWSAVLLLVYNPHTDFQRIQIIDVVEGYSKSREYGWEAFPKKLSIRRVFWTLDLMFNFRGIGWSYRYPEIRDGNANGTMDSVGLHSLNANRRGMAFIRAGKGKWSFVFWNLVLFLRDYFLLDFCGYLMQLDPFFRGQDTSDTLFSIPPGNVLITSSRLLLGLLSLYAGMDIFFVGFAVLAVGVFGDQEPWMHPRLWGPIQDCYHKGLSGFWGSFWQDIFGFGLGRLPRCLKLSTRPSHRYLQHLFEINCAFLISAVMHATGSYTMAANTSPFRHSLGHSLQGPGIALQALITSLLIRIHSGRHVIKVVVFGYSLVWWYLTASLLFDDLALGGFWRGKMVPWSFLNMLFPVAQ